MSKNFARSAKMSDPRQLDLFGDLCRDDPLAVYYRNLRRISATLSLDLAEDHIRVRVPDGHGVPAWAVRTALLHERIRADLLRVEHGIEPHEEPEELSGGATLHRLPPRRSPELAPPVRQRTPTDTRRGPGAA